MINIPGTVKKAVCIAVILAAVSGPEKLFAAEDGMPDLDIAEQEAFLENRSEDVVEEDTEELVEVTMKDVPADDPEDYEYPEESLEILTGPDTEEAERIRECIAGLPFGSAGRLYSEDLGINVKVEHYDMFSKENTNAGAQKIVDSEDTAIWMDYHIHTMLIGDHYHQGFEAIKQSVPGESILYLISPDGTRVQRYVCRKTEKGHNDGETILAEDGTDLLVEDPGGLLLYTCDGSWKNIFIAQYVLDTE